MIIASEMGDVLYTGTVRRSWHLDVFPVRLSQTSTNWLLILCQAFNACQWEDAHSILLLGFLDQPTLQQFVALFEIGRLCQE